MMPSVIGILVFFAGITLMYLGMHGAAFLPVYPKSHFDPAYVAPNG